MDKTDKMDKMDKMPQGMKIGDEKMKEMSCGSSKETHKEMDMDAKEHMGMRIEKDMTGMYYLLFCIILNYYFNLADKMHEKKHMSEKETHKH